MARKTSVKPEDQEQHPAAPQAGAGSADSAPLPQGASPSAGDGIGQGSADDPAEPAPVPTAPVDLAGASSLESTQPAVSLAASAAPAPSEDASSIQDKLDSESEDDELLLTFQVTDRSDVLHDGEWYYEGDLIVLNDADAEALLNNGCIMWPKDDAK
ncbi:hypothetical protein N5J43_00800 [Pseudomonas nicosulfuronedens]|uniref:hypothetical protein n=1 Tax=Pseudomonas nicosulfuronedens TaxID=2571105 RepID=UPI002448BF43|nr:hypothetical protein [Pseudomonas nicosulfuronedens]MDH1007419.1 hypothetical protein [Pseudomonas nicosulfuronedens]MDH1977465.1 hypothetical protein [Pseudomonas nicosulfuronedens]MDH2029009.1 hypothetical protein [Pseudomonas nicosulfuronedens]